MTENSSTLTTSLRINKTQLFNKTKLFEETAGVPIGGRVSTMDFRLDSPVELSAVSNFLMVSTDTRLELVIVQTNPVSGADPSQQKVDTVILPVTAYFLAYSRFGKVILRQAPGMKRIPKVSVIYS